MYLTDADIGFPEVRTNYVDVPGRDGMLDLSTALDGEIHYQDRTITPDLCNDSPIVRADVAVVFGVPCIHRAWPVSPIDV